MMNKILKNSIKNNTSVSFVSKVKIVFFLFMALYTMQPYFFWNRQIIQFFFASCILLFFVIQFTVNNGYGKRNINKNVTKQIIILIVFFVYWHFFKMLYQYVNIFGILGNVIMWFLPVLIFLISSIEEKNIFLDFFTNLMAVILSISLLAYLYVLFGGTLACSKITMANNKFYDYFENYKFFIVVHDSRNFSIFARFQSIFTEPGHLSMMAALLLYANNYRLKKWQNLVIFLSLIFTLSLAGYVLLIAGIFLHRFARSEKKIPMFLALFFVGILFCGITLVYYNSNPDSLVSRAIISRLIPDKKRGFSGNNRNTVRFKNAYKVFLEEGSIRTFTGWGNSMAREFPEGGNASYKNFIYEYGVIGFCLLWIMYLCFTGGATNLLPLCFFLLYILSFLQRPYATWLSQVFIFISYCSKDNSNFVLKEINSNRKIKR